MQPGAERSVDDGRLGVSISTIKPSTPRSISDSLLQALLKYDPVQKEVSLTADRSYEAGERILAWCGPQPNSRVRMRILSAIHQAECFGLLCHLVARPLRLKACAVLLCFCFLIASCSLLLSALPLCAVAGVLQNTDQDKDNDKDLNSGLGLVLGCRVCLLADVYAFYPFESAFQLLVTL